MKQQYAIYQFEDFLADDDFIRWVKYPNTESDNFWREVIATYPHQKQVIEKAHTAVQHLQQVLQKDIAHEEVDDIWANIEAHLDEPAVALKVVHSKRRYWLAAASIALLLGFSWWIMDKNVRSIAQKGQYTEGVKKHILNSEVQALTVNLPDGSMVSLEKNSWIEFEPNFNGNQRTVQLYGEALFDVVKNAEKPFVVYADNLVTKVLGTSFRIKSFANEGNETVKVLRGRVAVSENKKRGNTNVESSALVLTPNQQVVFNKAEGQMSRGLVDNPVVLVSQSELEKFAFDDTPVAKIFEIIEKTYGVKVLFDKEKLKNCTLTMRFRNETFFDRLTVICKSIGATYKIVDAQIIVEGKVCN